MIILGVVLILISCWLEVLDFTVPAIISMTIGVLFIFFPISMAAYQKEGNSETITTSEFICVRKK